MSTPNAQVSSRPRHKSLVKKSVVHHDIVIVGGGTAGISIAARLSKGLFNKTDVAVIDPSEVHYYQPAWTLVGGGAFRHDKTRRTEASVIPRKSKWIKDAVTEFEPEKNRLRTRDGLVIEYDYLIIAAGIQLNWDNVKGLKENVGSHGICSNYSFDTVASTWENIKNFQGGTAIFTQPAGAIKCGGAPQKICYLAEDYFRKHGVRGKTKVIFASANAAIFDVEKYKKALEGVIERKGIETMFNHNLVAISPDTNEAIFQHVETGDEVAVHYDMIHATPPQGPPDFIASSPLAGEGGWVELHKHTLQHVRFENVFGIGDCTSLPTAKTAASIRKQSPVLVKNLRSQKAGLPLIASYDGYASCPVVTGYGTLILAEFNYEKEPVETFPFDQGKERWTMWLLKKYGLPLLYWSGMLKGRV